MATKPTKRILDWASGGTTTDPGAGKEATGWQTNDRPPANWWNWILSSFGEWLTWAEASIDESSPKVLGLVSSGATAAVEWNGLGIDGVTAQSAHLVVDVTSAGFSASATSVVVVNHTAGSVYTAPTALFDNATTIRINAPRVVSTHAITDLTSDVFTFHLVAFGD